jgi:nitrate reductase gamma subunit
MSKVLWAPVTWFQANYFSAPALAVARILILLAGLTALVGLYYLGWRRRGGQDGYLVG